MIEGLWIVQFEGLQGEGAGVIVFENGKVLGGDGAYTYIGSYSVANSAVTARVKVSNFRPEIGNVMGIVGDYELQITAPIGDGILQGAMSLVNQPESGIAVRLTKRANL
jgi:hypothetical protein